MWFIFHEKLKKFLIWKFKVSHVPVLSVVLHVLRVWPGQGWMRVEIWKISYYRSIQRSFNFFHSISFWSKKCHVSVCLLHLIVGVTFWSKFYVGIEQFMFDETAMTQILIPLASYMSRLPFGRRYWEWVGWNCDGWNFDPMQWLH